MGAVLCTVGCLTASLDTIHYIHVLSPPSCDNQKCPLRHKVTLTPHPCFENCWSYLSDHCSQEDEQWRGEWCTWKEHGAQGSSGFDSLTLGPSNDQPLTSFPSSRPVFPNQRNHTPTHIIFINDFYFCIISLDSSSLQYVYNMKASVLSEVIKEMVLLASFS